MSKPHWTDAIPSEGEMLTWSGCTRAFVHYGTRSFQLEFTVSGYHWGRKVVWARGTAVPTKEILRVIEMARVASIR